MLNECKDGSHKLGLKMKSYLCERFYLREIAPQPWKNGAGITREIAAGPAGASPETFDWRISVAEVLQRSDGGLVHRLERRHEPFHFSGDLPLDATLLGGPSTDFNVMTRRGRFRAEVTPYDGAARLPGGEAGLLLCSEGDWQVEDPATLELGPLQGLLWREGRPPLSVRPLRPGPENCLLVVGLFAIV
jgi:environmental stress-induced protein Ves